MIVVAKRKQGSVALNIYFDLFLTFARIGVCTFGGGMAMLPILQREIVEKKHWAVSEELTDYYAIAQCTPGIIAVNIATVIGHKLKGTLGGILATVGVVFPSVVIISLIAAFLSNFADIPAVQHALSAVNACVLALIAASVIKLGKSTLKDLWCWGIFAAVLVCSFFFHLSPVLLVVISGFAGWLIRRLKRKAGDSK